MWKKTFSSYPPPDVVPEFTSVNPRPLPSLQDPPTNVSPPKLPSPIRDPLFGDQFLLTTHIFPAAYPRVSPDVAEPPLIPDGLSKEERKRFVAETLAKIVETGDKNLRGELGPGSNKVLWICLNRYVRKGFSSKSDGFTLLFAHAIGFSKEIWEPVMKYLIYSSEGHLVDEIWSMDLMNHGDSALVNEGNLPGICDWQDNTRDLLHFLLYYLPTSVSESSDPLPTVLPRLADSEAQFRIAHGLSLRRFVTIGHSIGGVTSVLAAINVPSLFPALILVDPGICQPGKYGVDSGPGIRDYASIALARKERWASRAEALDQFKNQALLRTWHPDVIKTYVEHALAQDKIRDYKLKLTGMQEAITCAHFQVPMEVFEQLVDLDSRVELRWLVPGVFPVHYRHSEDYEDQVRVRVWRRPLNASHIAVKGAGHLIPHEKPDLFAQELGGFLRRKSEKDHRPRTHL